MTAAHRKHLATALRRARAEHVLITAATRAMLERRARFPRFVRDATVLRGELQRGLLENEASTLISIETALQVLREAPRLYGTCIICGDAIAADVLGRSPWANRCAAHADDGSMSILS